MLQIQILYKHSTCNLKKQNFRLMISINVSKRLILKKPLFVLASKRKEKP